jgi:hypothetical protein
MPCGSVSVRACEWLLVAFGGFWWPLVAFCGLWWPCECGCVGMGDKAARRLLQAPLSFTTASHGSPRSEASHETMVTAASRRCSASGSDWTSASELQKDASVVSHAGKALAPANAEASLFTGSSHHGGASLSLRRGHAGCMHAMSWTCARRDSCPARTCGRNSCHQCLLCCGATSARRLCLDVASTNTHMHAHLHWRAPGMHATRGGASSCERDAMRGSNRGDTKRVPRCRHFEYDDKAAAGAPGRRIRSRGAGVRGSRAAPASGRVPSAQGPRQRPLCMLCRDSDA